MFKKLLLASITPGNVLIAGVPAQVAGNPNKTVRLVAPYAAGEASDILIGRRPSAVLHRP